MVVGVMPMRLIVGNLSRDRNTNALEVMTRPPIDRLRERFDSRHYPMEEFEEGKTITRGNSSVDAWRRSRHAINTQFMPEEKD